MTISLDRAGASDAEIADAVADAAAAAQDDGTLTVLTFAEGPAAVIAPFPAADPGREHQWTLLDVQEGTVVLTGVLWGKPQPRTLALARCTDCGEPGVFLLNGTWTLDQLTRPGEPAPS